jgi:predicted Zn-dependent peptidase
MAGTRDLDRSQLAASIERMGAELQASVERDYFLISGSVLAPNLRLLIDVVSQLVAGALYPVQEVKADRDRSADESAIALSRPEVLADEALRARLWAGHPYATGIPRPSALRRVSAAELHKMHRSVLMSSPLHLVLVGDLRPKAAQGLVEDALVPSLGALRSARSRFPTLKEHEPGPTVVVDRPASVQSNLRLGGPAPSRTDVVWPAMSLANLVFGGMFTSRLVENLRERHGYTYSPRSSVLHGRGGSAFVVAADVSTDVTAASLLETRYELGRMAIDGPTDDELESARRYSIGSFSFQIETLTGLASALTALSVSGVGPGYLTSYPKGLLKASKAEVREASRRFLAPRGLTTVVVGEARSVVTALSGIDRVDVRVTKAV